MWCNGRVQVGPRGGYRVFRSFFGHLGSSLVYCSFFFSFVFPSFFLETQQKKEKKWDSFFFVSSLICFLSPLVTVSLKLLPPPALGFSFFFLKKSEEKSNRMTKHKKKRVRFRYFFDLTEIFIKFHELIPHLIEFY